VRDIQVQVANDQTVFGGKSKDQGETGKN